jgi:polyphosphate kinase
MKSRNLQRKNRELSWLSFNYRVLQEAGDPRVPLYERLRFLAIFSANLDEFFRVRVAAIRSLLNLKKNSIKKFEFEPQKLLNRIMKVVEQHQAEFGNIFNTQIRRELNRQRISLVRETELEADQRAFALAFFDENVRSHLTPITVDVGKPAPFLKNRSLYLAIHLVRKASHGDESQDSFSAKPRYAILEIPTDHLPRFIMMPNRRNRSYIMFLDDLIRHSIATLFSDHDVVGVYSVKLTRDSGLYIDDEFTGDLLEKIKKALRRRNKGVPSRFLYDFEMPKELVAVFKEIFSLSSEDLVRGGRYHNFNDFFSFPNPHAPRLEYDPLPPVSQAQLDASSSIAEAVKIQDHALHFPYHSFDYVIRFLRESADDPDVRSISIVLYRVAKKSRIAEELMRAARNGKTVTAFVEVKARFDEEPNIRWAQQLESEGVRVLYSFPGLKVHAKMCLVTRSDDANPRQIAYLSTGNFNESSARVYADTGLFTSDQRIINEVDRVFRVLSGEETAGPFDHLLVAPFTMRESFERLIDSEIRNAKKGMEASIRAKINSLEDPQMISKLYEASQNGVRVSLIVRGICCLIPATKGHSENIEVVSIVDRFLEHSRVFVFHNGGDELYFLSSADWMTRNLSRRIEVGFPVYDRNIQEQLRTILEFQLSDSVKARTIARGNENKYRAGKSNKTVRSQYEIYDYLKSLTNPSSANEIKNPALPPP